MIIKRVQRFSNTKVKLDDEMDNNRYLCHLGQAEVRELLKSHHSISGVCIHSTEY